MGNHEKEKNFKDSAPLIDGLDSSSKFVIAYYLSGVCRPSLANRCSNSFEIFPEKMLREQDLSVSLWSRKIGVSD